MICIQTKIITFKSLKNLAPQYLFNLFNKNSACTSRNLGNNNTDAWLPKLRTTQGKKAFFFPDSKILNSLPFIYCTVHFKYVIY